MAATHFFKVHKPSAIRRQLSVNGGQPKAKQCVAVVGDRAIPTQADTIRRRCLNRGEAGSVTNSKLPVERFRPDCHGGQLLWTMRTGIVDDLRNGQRFDLVPDLVQCHHAA